MCTGVKVMPPWLSSTITEVFALYNLPRTVQGECKTVDRGFRQGIAILHWHCLVERLQSANYRNFDLLINYSGDTEANSTDYNLIYGKPETLVAELDSAPALLRYVGRISRKNHVTTCRLY